MAQFIDLTGHRYGRLTVSRRANNVGARTAWHCICDCGAETIATGNDLRCGKVASCGCIRRENASRQAPKAAEARGKQLKKHGFAGTRLYNIWKAMRERCNNPNDKHYADYGGRGIQVCPEWSEFMPFYNWAMANGYDPSAPFGVCTLDRAENNGNYSPDNCRWVDLVTQANNRRDKHV